MPENATALAGYRPWLCRFAWFVCFATFLLILVGGEVKSREAGLSVPDWPTTYGENMFTYPYSKWKEGQVFYEHFHRLMAAAIGMLTIVLTVAVWVRDRRRWMKVLAGVALLAVILQGVLGGLTVLLHLPVWTSSAHGMLAQTFLLMLVLLAYGLSKERAERVVRGAEVRTSVVTWALLLIGALYVQLLLGALVRHTESAMAIPDFPTTAGSWVPRLSDEGLGWVNQWRQEHIRQHPDALFSGDVTKAQMHIHFTHRAWALVVLVVVFLATKAAARQRQAFPKAFRTMHLVGALLLVQILLGAGIVWTARTPMVSTLHVGVGALLLAAAFLMLLRACPVKPLPPESGGGSI